MGIFTTLFSGLSRPPQSWSRPWPRSWPWTRTRSWARSWTRLSLQRLSRRSCPRTRSATSDPGQGNVQDQNKCKRILKKNLETPLKRKKHLFILIIECDSECNCFCDFLVTKLIIVHWCYEHWDHEQHMTFGTNKNNRLNPKLFRSASNLTFWNKNEMKKKHQEQTN